MPYNPEIHGPVRIVGPGFYAQVYQVVRQIPSGRVATYGDIGTQLGSSRVARQVGFALAALPESQVDVPWFRVVNAQGKVSPRTLPGRDMDQQQLLMAEGVEVDARGRVMEFERLRFRDWPAGQPRT